ncbi:hypothetical protein PAHAL_5G056600 [Panicum hallii]|uniref:Uncharacterized protein n=1 Tax=Panicum hallii TaxID=206008 RepID=A0A2S3HP39_9POAL|nr:hypothetical protein PAHAL_5G056600 [Panicum hallii]
MDAATATALVVACAESSLPSRAEDLLMLAEKLGAAADGYAVFELGRAAAALGEEAATLTRACDGFGHLVAAIRTVRAGAEAWWAKWTQSKIGGEVHIEAHLLAKDLRLSHSHKGATIADIPAAGQVAWGCVARRDARQVFDRAAGVRLCTRRMFDRPVDLVVFFGGFAVIGLSSTLRANYAVVPAVRKCTQSVRSGARLSYMGPDGVLKTDVYTPWYRRCAGAAFSLMWCLVGLGVPCLFVRSRIQHFYSRLFSRIGMLAVTQLVIFYSHWLLFPDWVVALWVLVTVSAFLHIGLFHLDGDM